MAGGTLGELVFELDGRGARLVLRGPQLGPLSARPGIGVTRDQQGRFHLAVGVNEYIYAASELPAELRRLLEGAGAGRPRGGALAPVRMPTADQLRLPDGAYMTFQQYENARVGRIIASAADPQTAIWPVLPQPVYEALRRFYSGLGERLFRRM
jgi:hypothetical protein